MLIEMKEVSKKYQMGEMSVQALQAVNLKIEANEYVAIMGPSGSGKSTMMNILGCLDTPTDGRYSFGDHDVQDLNDDALSGIRNQKIGFVFQSFHLLSRSTALENVELPLIYTGFSPAHRRKLAEEALTRVGLGDRFSHKPNELSGGQCQRVAIARALVTEPKLILADEPTGNLDSKTGEEIMTLIQQLHEEGNCVILVTHEVQVAEKAQRVIRLHDGRIESDGRTNKNRPQFSFNNEMY